MCELFAISARHSVWVGEALREFFADSRDHPHGWGLSLESGRHTLIHKEPVRAIDSTRLAALLDRPISTRRLVAHIRKATRGAMAYENCHPFVGHDVTGRCWVLAHNGTMLDDTLIRGADERAKGETDSERVLLHLLDRVDHATGEKGAPLDADERTRLMAEVVEELAPHNKLNLVVDDGECIFAHTNTSSHTLFVQEGRSCVTLCTRPLGDGRGWEPVERCALVVFAEGRLSSTHPVAGQTIDEDLYLKAIAGEASTYLGPLRRTIPRGIVGAPKKDACAPAHGFWDARDARGL